MMDLLIVGAGPIGLEAAIQAKRAGLSYRVFEKGALVEAIYRYPTYMTFFTTAERLEIGGHPFVTATDKATRKEALDYYRKVVKAEDLAVEPYSEVTHMERTPRGFRVTITPGRGEPYEVEARRVALATGYFDNPNLLGIPGEDLPQVSHAFDEGHGWYDRNVVIVGAGSSAADAALELHRAGAKVTMLHRGADFKPTLKYWIRPNLENRVKEGSIQAHFLTTIERITAEAVEARQGGELHTFPAERVYLLTGYHASTHLLDLMGAERDPVTLAATLDEHYQTSVPGLYAIGSAGFGRRTSEVFIENGLLHAQAMVAHLSMTPVG